MPEHAPVFRYGNNIVKQRLPLVAFVLSVAILAFAYGFASAFRHWQPAPVIIGAYEAAEDLWQHWRNDLGFAPTRLLVPAPNPRQQTEPAAGSAMAATDTDRPRMRIAIEERAMEGYRLISGLTRGYKDALFGALLLDRSGAEIHFWAIDFRALSPRGRSPTNVFPHGLVPMRDGSIIVNFDGGDVLARIGACGETMWVTPGGFHHGMSLSHDGTLWAWENEPLPDTGTA